MKIKATGIEFDNVKDITRFVYENDLIGVLELIDPIKDQSGNILIKEKIGIKDNALKKLTTLEGQYDPKFNVNITKELTTKLRNHLTKEIMPKIESDKGGDIVPHLYEHNQSSVNNYKGFVNNSFYTKTLTLCLYRLWLERNDFFQHMVNMGLLCLGAVVQKPYQFKLIHRYSFLAGMLADVALSETDYWMKPYSDEVQIAKVSTLSASLCENLGLPAEIVSVIRQHTVKGIYSEGVKLQIDFNSLNKNPLFEVNDRADSSSSSEDGDNEEDKASKEEIVNIVSEGLKIARFISETSKKITANAKESFSEQLLVVFTYNTEKGMFLKEMADPMINRFKEFDQILKKTRKIAELENRCKFYPAAWAYPKPKATQILCKNKVYECPNFIGGWDINIISPQEALGYIGTALTPGSYPKCKLEKELDKVD